MSNLQPIEFYFDLSSPYSYLASDWIEKLAARYGRRVQWHAILLGATFAVAQLKPLTAHPLKGEYALIDFARSARFGGLKFVKPETFPIATQNAARLFWWLESQDPLKAADWAKRCFAAYFAEGQILSDTAVLRALASQTGLDADTCENAWATPLWKAKLKQENDAAIAKGVFGAPFFRIDDEPFWGNDRRQQMERWLAEGPY